METQSKYFRIPREEIAFFKCIVEAYEGMAVVRTKDPNTAVIELMIAPGWERDVDELLRHLGREIPIEPFLGE